MIIYQCALLWRLTRGNENIMMELSWPIKRCDNVSAFGYPKAQESRRDIMSKTHLNEYLT